LERTAMRIASGGSNDSRNRRATVTVAVPLCAALVVIALPSVFGLAQVLEGVKVVLLLLFVVICLTLAVFALLVAGSALLPLRRRGFGDWL
jgi:hypothetical protein